MKTNKKGQLNYYEKCYGCNITLLKNQYFLNK